MFRGFESYRGEVAPSVAQGMWRIGEMLGTNETLVAGSFPMHMTTRHFKGYDRGWSPKGDDVPRVLEFYTAKSATDVECLVKAMRVRGEVTDMKVLSGEGERDIGKPMTLDSACDVIPPRELALACELGVIQTIQQSYNGAVPTSREAGLRVTATVSGRIINGCSFDIVCVPAFCPHAPRQLFDCFDWDVLRVAASPPVSSIDTHVMVHMSRHTRRAINTRTAHFTSLSRSLSDYHEYEALSKRHHGLNYSPVETKDRALAAHASIMRGVELMRFGFMLSPDGADNADYGATLADLRADEELKNEEGMSRVALLSAEIEHAERTVLAVENAQIAFSSAIAEVFGTINTGTSAMGVSVDRTFSLIKMDLSEDRIFLAALKSRFYRSVCTRNGNNLTMLGPHPKFVGSS